MLVMLKKIAAISLALVVLYSLVGFFALPAFMRPKLEKELSLALNREVTISGIEFNPFVLGMRAKGFMVKDTRTKAPFVSFDELYVNVQARSIIKGGLVIQDVLLKKPEIHVARLDPKTYSFSDLLVKKPEKKQKKPAKPFLFSVGNIRIENGSVEFAPGITELSDREIKKYDTLTKILTDKPSLNLELRGYADQENDNRGLAEYLFENKLKVQKVMERAATGKEALQLNDITITPEEYPRYLKKAYQAETFPKPTNTVGLPADLPVKEMEALIRKHIEVKDSDLRLLAMNRAQKVQEYLVSVRGVSNPRIFLIGTNPYEEPKNASGQEGSNGSSAAALSSLLKAEDEKEVPRSKLRGIENQFNSSPSPVSSPPKGEDNRVTPQQAAGYLLKAAPPQAGIAGQNSGTGPGGKRLSRVELTLK